MNASQLGQVCRSGAITSSRSGRARADILAIPHLHRCRDHNVVRAQSANLAGLEGMRLVVSPHARDENATLLKSSRVRGIREFTDQCGDLGQPLDLRKMSGLRNRPEPRPA